jgi:hypothetical protein
VQDAVKSVADLRVQLRLGLASSKSTLILAQQLRTGILSCSQKLGIDEGLDFTENVAGLAVPDVHHQDVPASRALVASMKYMQTWAGVDETTAS